MPSCIPTLAQTLALSLARTRSLTHTFDCELALSLIAYLLTLLHEVESHDLKKSNTENFCRELEPKRSKKQYSLKSLAQIEKVSEADGR